LPLIRPKHNLSKRFSYGSQPTWTQAVLCFRDAAASEEVVEHFKAKPLDKRMLWNVEPSADQPSVYSAEIGGQPFLLATRCVWGGPQAAIFVEELAAMGCKRLFGIGAAGSLSKDLKVGEQVVAVEAPAMDGTSRAYTYGSSGPDPALLTAAQAAAAQTRTPLRSVKAASVDALYRGSPTLVNHWRLSGLDMVAMEVAAFYASAAGLRVKALWLGHVTDTLAEGWKDRFQPPPGIVETTCALVERCLR
jgi:uridine phosphorylase